MCVLPTERIYPFVMPVCLKSSGRVFLLSSFLCSLIFLLFFVWEIVFSPSDYPDSGLGTAFSVAFARTMEVVFVDTMALRRKLRDNTLAEKNGKALA